MIDKGRLIAITDGIIAVAATVMVLQLRVPERATLAAAQEQFPTLLAYIISYLQVFLAWHEHHDAFANAKAINHRIFLLNCLWLFFITLLPYATGIVGNSPNDRTSVLLYLSILFLQSLIITIVCRQIEKLNHIDSLDNDIIHVLRKVTFPGYALAAVCTFIKPLAAFVVIVVSCVISIVVVCFYDKKKRIGETCSE